MDKEYLQKKLGEIEDPRHQGYTEHKLPDILIMIMSAVMSGIAKFAANRAQFFHEFFGI